MCNLNLFYIVKRILILIFNFSFLDFYIIDKLFNRTNISEFFYWFINSLIRNICIIFFIFIENIKGVFLEIRSTPNVPDFLIKIYTNPIIVLIKILGFIFFLDYKGIFDLSILPLPIKSWYEILPLNYMVVGYLVICNILYIGAAVYGTLKYNKYKFKNYKKLLRF